MILETIKKGTIYSADCQKCGVTNFWHEWLSDVSSEDFTKTQCEHCYGVIGGEPFKHPRKEYACRYTEPGYLDCTPWEYDSNRRRLEKMVRDIYGE
jgi:hypothetical protein